MAGEKVQDSPVYQTLHTFFHHYMVERNKEKTLAMLSEHFCSIGTGEGEVAIGKQAFGLLLDREFASVPMPIRYAMSDYVQHERVPGCWDTYFAMETQLTLPDGSIIPYKIRVTTSLHREREGYLIDCAHASEASRSQGKGEFYPLKFISQDVESLSAETRQQLIEIIGQIMPGGIVGGYMEEGFPLSVANEQLLGMAGYQSYQEFKQDIHGLILNSIHPDDRDYIRTEMEKVRSKGDQYEIQYRMKKKDGSYFWVHNIGRRTVAANGQDAIISVLIDITEQVHTKTTLEKAALTDPLTGIYNRKGGQARIEESVRTIPSYIFLMMDLDNFKQLNDHYGHKQGDQVLCMAAKLLSDSFRKSDTVCRLGGDEFCVLVEGCQDIAAIQRKMEGIMEQCRAIIRAHWPLSNCGLSVGGVFAHKPYSFTELYQWADELLYEVKRTQKGGIKLRELDATH